MKAQDINQSVFLTYELELKDHRSQFLDFIAPFLAENDPKVILLFWINFSYLGVGMTEPVEDWIRRAGENCKKLGFNELGVKLCKHAIHEADHHLMMIDDAKHLIARWNNLYQPTLEANDLLNLPLRECVKKYQVLHENYIEGTMPYCQIAIEYEIENLSEAYGSKIMAHTDAILGKNIKESLSFVDEHVKIDVAHTAYNRKAISDLLNINPKARKDLVTAGAKALDIYGGFLNDCYQLASAFKTH